MIYAFILQYFAIKWEKILQIFVHFINVQYFKIRDEIRMGSTAFFLLSAYSMQKL